MKKLISYIIGSALLIAGSTSCSKEYMDLGPENSTTADQLFSSPESAQYHVNGMCRLMQSQYQGDFGQGFNGEGTIKLYFGELTGVDAQRPLHTGWSNPYNFNYNQSGTSIYNYYCWYYYYKQIGNANILLENCKPGTSKDLDYVIAQALTIRAYGYAQLAQWYCRRWSDRNGESRGLPLRLDTSSDEIGASSMKAVYKQIYKDLDDAIALFKSCGKSRASGDYWHPSIEVAHAIYTRAAMNREDWDTAIAHAKEARKGHPIMGITNYEAGFYQPNSEWIWDAYQDSNQNIYYYSYHAYTAVNANTSVNRNYPWAISKELIEQIPETDKRLSLFVRPTEDEVEEGEDKGLDPSKEVTNKNNPTYYARVKKDYGQWLQSSTKLLYYMTFKVRIEPGTAYGVGEVVLFRSAEMYYSEAEAYCAKGDDANARKALEEAVTPYDPKFSAENLSGDALRDEIRKYRRFDLYQEGNNFPDFKRWGLDHIRHKWSEGGSWTTNFCGTGTTGGCFGPNDKNKWCLCYPSIETTYNKAVTTFESDDWRPDEGYE